ncbi:MAG: AsmA-like C-terminal region-containing protein, partial [Flavobacteriales bacterium]|nr:AsmA-like C-terminal region-containing protein [Flavobacteriales bacterium]
MKFLKRTFLFFILLLLLVLSGVLIAGLYYGDEIKLLIVKNLNESLKTEIKVSQIDFSVLESFPKASIVFSDVVIFAVDAKNDTLLSAKKLSVKFNLIDLYKEKYKLIGLEIDGGKCEMVVDDSGRANYIFWEQSDSNTNLIAVELEKVVLSNMQYTYINYSKTIGVSFLIDHADLTGNFKEQIFDLNLKTKLKNADIQIKETRLFENRTLYLAIQGSVDQANERLNFASSNLGVDGMNISINGDLSYGSSNKLNLNLESKNADLEKAIALLPQSVRLKLERFNIDGEAELKGIINGDLSKGKAPFYDFNFSIRNGKFIDKKSDLSFKKSVLKGSISNGTERKPSSTSLILDHFSSTLKQGEIDGSLSISNFKRPKYQYSGNLSFELQEVFLLLEEKALMNPIGGVYAKIEVEGQLAEMGKYSLQDWKNSKIKGQVTLKNIGFDIKGKPQKVREVNSNLNFNNHSLIVSNLRGVIDKSDFELEGKFNNLIGFLLEKNEPLFIDANLSSPHVNLSDLLKSNEEANTTNTGYELDISPRVTVYLGLKVDALQFNKLKLKDLKGDLIVKNERIDARNISFSSQEGKVLGDLFIKEKGKELSISSRAEFTEVDIHKVFTSFNNFGQSSLKAEHIKGNANIDLNFNSTWSKQLQVKPESIQADVSFIISDGELNNYKPMEALSRFVKLEELKSIQFSQLQNRILIKNELITIPRFEILSSAMNLSIAGTHSFTNDVDYHITLLLSELLRTKAKKFNSSEFGTVVNDGLEKKSKLYLKMTGNIDDLKVAYDTKELKA